MRLATVDKINFFIDKTNEKPEIFTNFQRDFFNTIELTKNAILYAIEKDYFAFDDELLVSLTKKTIKEKNNIAENIGKLYSTKSTAFWYNYFKVNIDAI